MVHHDCLIHYAEENGNRNDHWLILSVMDSVAFLMLHKTSLMT